MAAGKGFDSNRETEIVNWITGGSVPGAITGNMKIRLLTTAADPKNDTAGTQCGDAAYVLGGQAVTAWGAAATTSGTGAAGFTQKAHTTPNPLTYPAGAGATAFAAQFVCHGYEMWDQTGTSKRCMYQSLGTDVTIPINQQLTVAAGSMTVTQQGV